MTALSSWFGQLPPQVRSAGIAVVCGAATVMVLSLFARRMRRWLFMAIIIGTALIAWWWTSVHGVVDQVHSLISGR